MSTQALYWNRSLSICQEHFTSKDGDITLIPNPYSAQAVTMSQNLCLPCLHNNTAKKGFKIFHFERFILGVLIWRVVKKFVLPKTRCSSHTLCFHVGFRHNWKADTNLSETFFQCYKDTRIQWSLFVIFSKLYHEIKMWFPLVFVDE